jgi:hypothetical protein
MVTTKPVAPVYMSMAGTTAPGSVTINVFDAYTNRVLYPSIIAQASDGSTHKDLDALPIGAYSILISKSGYFSKRESIVVSEGSAQHINISLV